MYERKRHPRRIPIRFKLLAVLLLLLLGFYQAQKTLAPIVTELAQNRARMISTEAVNQAVTEELANLDITYEDLVKLERDSKNNVVSLESNVVEINKLKADITLAAQERVCSYQSEAAKIPLGTLLGSDFTAGWGPEFTIKLQLASNATSQVTNSFHSAGINQTCHQVMMTITTQVYVILAGHRSTVEVSSDYCLAETVIVGLSPNAYTVVQEAKPSEDAEIINDYGAGR